MCNGFTPHPLLPYNYSWFNGVIFNKNQTDKYNKLTQFINTVSGSVRDEYLEERYNLIMLYFSTNLHRV